MKHSWAHSGKSSGASDLDRGACYSDIGTLLRSGIGRPDRRELDKQRNRGDRAVLPGRPRRHSKVRRQRLFRGVVLLENAKKSTPRLAPSFVMMAQLFVDGNQPLQAIAMLEQGIARRRKTPKRM